MIKLAPKKREWVGLRTVTLRGVPLSYNVSQQQKYKKAIRELVATMTEETQAELVKLFKRDGTMDADETITTQSKRILSELTKRFQRLFNRKSTEIVDKMLEGALKSSATSLHTSLEKLSGGLTLRTSAVPKELTAITQAIVNENLSLIRSIPQEYLNDVRGSVMRSIATGNGLKDLEPEIRKYKGITQRRVNNIALDQTRKTYNAINRERMKAIGVNKFRWLHSGGGQHPRKSHEALSGKVFSFDNTPIINAEQVARGYESPQRGIPGQAINCKCTMEPVLEYDDGEQQEA